MITITYEEIIQKAGKEIEPRVYYYNENNEIVEISREYFIQAKISFNAGIVGSVMEALELETKVELPDTAIYLDVKAKFDVDEATKTYGAYYRKEKPTYNADQKTYTYKMYDSLLNLMVDYKPISIEYPTTIYMYFIELLHALNFTTDILNLPNGEKIIERDIYDGINFTYRDVLDDIGEATGTLFKVEDKVVKKCSFGTEAKIVDDDILKNQNISMGQHFGPINVLVLSRGGDADRIFYPEELPQNPNEFKITENQLMNNNDRDEYMEAIYNEIQGIEYDIYDCQLVGFGGFKPLDKLTLRTIEFVDVDNTVIEEKEYNSFVFNNEIIITQGYEESIYTELPEEGNTNYKAADTTDKRLSSVELQANKQDKYIKGLVKDMYESDGIVQENFTSIYQNISSIITNVQSSGGDNLIKNSVMFAYDSNNVPNNWDVEGEGTLTISESVESLNAGCLSGNVFTLADKKVKQRVYVKADNDNIPEDQKIYYTFSTKIKKNKAGVCYAKLSNTNEEHIIQLNEGEDSYYGDYEISSLLPKVNYYDIEFFGDINSGATFTDNMLAVGEYKTQWTQANGEIMNTQVNIDNNGILVKSSIYDGDYTVMSPLEFAGYSNISGNSTKVFSLNKDTTVVKKLKAEDEIDMPPIKIVPVTTGEIQGWAFVPVSGGDI